MNSVLLLVFFLALGTHYQGARADKYRICYYTNWSQYRPEPYRFTPGDIDPSLCTHIIFSFATMSGNRLAPFEWNDESTPWSTGLYEQVTALKQTDPSLKVVLAVGGWNFGTTRMTAMLRTARGRTEFVNSAVTFLRSRDFDGLDLDFEYPGNRGSPPVDKQRFSLLVQELRARFAAEASDTLNPRVLSLSVAVGCGATTIDTAYDIHFLALNVDWIGLMSYDFSGAWDRVTGLNSPLYCHDSTATDYYRDRTTEWCASRWLSGGAPRDKLVIGLATYGRGFTLANQNQHDMYSAVIGGSRAGTYTREPGILAFHEICSTFFNNGGTRLWSEDYGVPYVFRGNQWIGYDDIQSIKQKVEWLLSEGYSGYMVWNLDFDDFNGLSCGYGRYPLLTTMKNTLLGLPPPEKVSGDSKTAQTVNRALKTGLVAL